MNRSTPDRPARPLRRRVAGAGLLAATLVLVGCSDAEQGAFLGAGLGALAGQAIGGDTEATLIGAGVGGAVGYGVGNESDKRRSEYHYDRRHHDY